MEVTWHGFREHWDADDPLAGTLVAVEGERDVPFAVRRVYYMYGVEAGVSRGFHAHKMLQQVLMCVHGSCVVTLDNGRERMKVHLDSPSRGIYVGPAMWREMSEFSPGAVLLVLASDFYDESDYIRDYGEFLRYVGVSKSGANIGVTNKSEG